MGLNHLHLRCRAVVLRARCELLKHNLVWLLSGWVPVLGFAIGGHYVI
jgi:hypothetical protein